MAKLTILFVLILVSSFLMSLFLTFSLFKINGILFSRNPAITNSRTYVAFAFVLSWISFVLLIILLIFTLLFRSFLSENKCDIDLQSQNNSILLFLFVLIAFISLVSTILSFMSLILLSSSTVNNSPLGNTWIYCLLSTIFGIVLFILLLVIFFMYRSSSKSRCKPVLSVNTPPPPNTPATTTTTYLDNVLLDLPANIYT